MKIIKVEFSFRITNKVESRKEADGMFLMGLKGGEEGNAILLGVKRNPFCPGWKAR